jgi:hypothetical protein
MNRIIALVLSALLVLVTHPAMAQFFAPGNLGAGFIGGSSVPELVRLPSDYGTVLRDFNPSGAMGSQAGTNYDVSGSNITKAWDSSGNAQHVTAPATADGPLYVANCINGFACMDIGSNPSNKRQLNLNNDNTFQNRAGVSVYYLTKITDTNKYLNALLWTVNGSFSTVRTQLQVADGTNRLFIKGKRLDADGLTQNFSINNGYTQNQWMRVEGLYDFTGGTQKVISGTQSSLALTQVASGTLATSGGNSENLSSGWFLIGHNAANATSNPEYLGRILIFDGAHTFGQRTGVDNIFTHAYLPGLAPLISAVTSQLARWEIRDNPKYITKDTVSTTTVSEILDITGNGNKLTQATKAKQAALDTTKRIGATFTAANAHEYALTSGKLGIIKNQAIVCDVVVFKPASNHVGYLAWFSEGTVGSSYRFAMRTNASGKLEFYHRRADGGSGFSITSTNSYDVGQQNVGAACVNYTANTAKVVLNDVTTSGAAGSTGTFSNTDSLNAYVGSSGGANYFDGVIRMPGLLFTDDTQLTAATDWAKWTHF